MKKMLLATALAYLLGYAQQTFTVQNKPAAVAQRNHHPSFLRFWNWAKKTVDAAKICGGAENVVKEQTQQTFVNGLLGFITLEHLYSMEAQCILLTIIAWCPIDALSALLINILLGSFQLFLHSDQPL